MFILAEEPDDNVFQVPSLPEGTEPTFENYVNYFEELGGDISSIQSVVFYDKDADGNIQESFEITAPEGGFSDSAELLDAYNDAIAAMGTEEADPGLEFMSSLTTEIIPEDDPVIEDEEDDLETV